MIFRLVSTLILGSIWAQLAMCEPAQTIKLGLLVCLNGGCAEPGLGLLRGAELAVEDINAGGGVIGQRFEILVEDSQEDQGPSYVISAYKKLSEWKNVRLFIGPTWTPGGLSLGPLVARNKSSLLISPTLGARAFSQAGENIFNTRGVDEAATRATAQQAFKAGIRRMAIFSSQQPWDQEQGQIFHQEFESLGGKILIKVEPVPSATDLRTEALKIVALKPEAIFFSCYAQLPLASREIQLLHFAGGKYAALIDNLILEQAAASLDGAVFHSFVAPDAAFSKRVTARYGNTGLLYAAVGYDTVMMLAAVIKSAGKTEGRALQDALKSYQYSGVAGSLKFDKDRVAQRPIAMWKVVKGAIVSGE